MQTNLAQKHSTDLQPELSARQRFATEACERLDDQRPVAVLKSSFFEEIWQNGKPEHLGEQLLKIMLNCINPLEYQAENLDFDFVLLYRVYEGRLYFGDERIEDINKEDRLMRINANKDFPALMSLNNANLISLLIEDSQVIMDLAERKSNATFWVLIEDLIKNGKTIGLIIEDTHNLLPTKTESGSTTLSTFGDDRMNLARMQNLIYLLKKNSGSRMILMGNEGNWDAELKMYGVKRHQLPPTQSADLQPVLEPYISGSALARALALSVGLEVNEVIRIAEDAKSPDKIVASLIKSREQAIINQSEGLLEVSLREAADDEIALCDEAQKFWDEQIKGFDIHPELANSKYLLVGPPGTGKSVLPKFLAAKLGIPYLKLSDLSTSGLYNVSLDRAKIVFDTIFKNKPCVLHLDEVDKLLPFRDGVGSHSNNNQLMAYIQDRLADDDFMTGVIVIATTNEPQNISDAMLRDGRFGTKIYMGPPKNADEKLAVFKATWNQLGSSRDIQLPEDEILRAYLAPLPEHAMGASFKELLRGVLRKVKIEEVNISQALFEALQDTVFPKSQNYDEINQQCLSIHNGWDLEPQKTNKPAKKSISQLQGLQKTIRHLKSEIELRQSELRQLNEQIEDERAIIDGNAERLEGVQAEYQKLKAQQRASLEELERIQKFIEGEKEHQINLGNRAEQIKRDSKAIKAELKLELATHAQLLLQTNNTEAKNRAVQYLEVCIAYRTLQALGCLQLEGIVSTHGGRGSHFSSIEALENPNILCELRSENQQALIEGMMKLYQAFSQLGFPDLSNATLKDLENHQYLPDGRARATDKIVFALLGIEKRNNKYFSSHHHPDTRVGAFLDLEGQSVEEMVQVIKDEMKLYNFT